MATAGKAGSRLRILLVEDDEVSRVATVGLLEKSGHDVMCAINGAEVVPLLLEYDFDIVLMDIQMPVVDGISATAMIRRGAAGASLKNLPVIAITAYVQPEDKTRFFDVGVDDFVPKPVKLEQLLEKIESVMAAKGH